MNKFIVLIVLILLPWFSYSQEMVEGVVLDSDGANALSLSGANVYWQDSQTGVVTDYDGKFSIPFLKEFNKLIISYVGYESDTLTLNQPKSESSQVSAVNS